MCRKIYTVKFSGCLTEFCGIRQNLFSAISSLRAVGIIRRRLDDRFLAGTLGARCAFRRLPRRDPPLAWKTPRRRLVRSACQREKRFVRDSFLAIMLFAVTLLVVMFFAVMLLAVSGKKLKARNKKQKAKSGEPWAPRCPADRFVLRRVLSSARKTRGHESSPVALVRFSGARRRANTSKGVIG